MDDLVKQAMARWPDVPAMFGWLRLDRRGKWYLIDRGRPGFDAQLDSDALGSSITSPSIVDFIARNYQADDTGRWFWQNGPQRVFVDLDLAPLIFRVFENATQQTLVSHCGDIVNRIDALASTPSGELWLRTDLGPGVVHDLDLAQLDLLTSAEDDLRLQFGALSFSVTALPDAREAQRWAGFEAKPQRSN